MLNHIEIKSNNIIQNSNINNFRNASYDLSVHEIITNNGKREKSYKIKPNTMAIVISKETIVLPNNIIGHAFVKTSLSQKGIMANNIGIIDTEYNGQLSSVLVNFGKNEYEINEGETFLRITFTKIPRITSINSIPNQNGPLSKKDYVNLRTIDAMKYLGNSFINIDKVVVATRKEINKSLQNTAKVIGIWVGAIGLLLTAFSVYTNVKDATKHRIENIESQINTFNDSQLILLKIQKEQENKVIRLKTQLDSIQIENNKLKLGSGLKKSIGK